MKISFDEAKAQLWKAKVEEELELVAKINSDAGQCMQDLAEEGDPLTVILKRTGSQIEDFGSTMRSKFKEGMLKLGQAIVRYATAHENIIDDANAAGLGH